MPGPLPECFHLKQGARGLGEDAERCSDRAEPEDDPAAHHHTTRGDEDEAGELAAWLRRVAGDDRDDPTDESGRDDAHEDHRCTRGEPEPTYDPQTDQKLHDDHSPFKE